jgi:ethanolamine-phosphate cytidylyltransferase
METRYENLDDEQIKFLLIYNNIKNNDKIKEIAEFFEKVTQKSSSEDANDFTQIKMKKLNMEVEYTAKQIVNYFNTTNNLSAQKILGQRKPIKIYMDGVFDIIHSGHFNAIRQSKKLGDVLIVGVNSDEDVEKSKGPTLMSTKERAALVRACKWVDEVIEDTPYTPDVKLLDEVGADFCAHGDDMPVNNLGVGCYDKIIAAGRLKVFKRTEGISTTEIIGRLLSCAKISHLETSESPLTSADYIKKVTEVKEDDFSRAPIMSNFLPTSWRVSEFCNNKVPKENDKIVYIDGSFDVLHIGHIDILKKAKEQGDFLYVGLHDDATVNKYRGKNYPILNLQERTFNLLALKYVDEVIIGAPWAITEDLIKSLKIDLVVQGTAKKTDEFSEKLEDSYAVPKKIGIYKEIESPYDLDNEILVQRLINKRGAYVQKYKNKIEKEAEYYNSKGFLGEI